MNRETILNTYDNSVKTLSETRERIAAVGAGVALLGLFDRVIALIKTQREAYAEQSELMEIIVGALNNAHEAIREEAEAIIAKGEKQ